MARAHRTRYHYGLAATCRKTQPLAPILSVMNKEDIEQTILDSLARIAPEVDVATIDPDASFRDQFDFDSMNYLSLMLDLDKKLGLHIPELDYPKLSSLSSCVAYLESMLDRESRPA